MAETEVIITKDQFGRDVTIPIDENGNIILYRATDDPNRIIDSDFRPLAKDKGSVGLGQQSYFSPNPMYSHKYESSGRKNYKFLTEIKPNQILATDFPVNNYPELVKVLNIPEEYTNQNWRQLVNNDKAMIAMGYEAGGKRFFNDNIQTFKDNGIKAFGSVSTGTGGQPFIEYEIIPLVKEGDTLGIKPIATLQTKEGFAAGKSPEAFIETSLDTPTNVVDVGNVHENPNYKVSLNVDNNGNVIIYRSTNTPDRLSNTDFSKFEINKTIGEQTYFASNPEFAQSFSQSGRRNIYSFSTNIKPEEILHLQSNIYKNKELLNKLGGQEYINNIVNERGINNYRFDSLDNIPKNFEWAELYYSTNKGRTDGSKDILQREIVKLQNNGVKAIGVSPVAGAKNEYNILPIINEQSQLDIVAKGLMDKNLIETSLDTPTNVVDDVMVTRGLSNAEMAIPTNVELVKDTYVISTDTPTNVVGNEFVDEIVNANTQLVNDLPLSETVKNQFDNVVRNRAKNLATPGGVIDAVDVWEIGVLGLMITAIAYKEFDEIPTIFKRTATNMFNSMTSMYNIPPVPLEQYDLDYEFIEKVITTGEKVMPTDIIIKKVQEKAEEFEGESTASGYAYMTPSAKNTDTMETTQKIQPGVQEEKMFEEAKPKKTKSAGGSGAKIL